MRLRQNIILATPTSLVALLKAIAYGWQQTALAHNAAEIRTSALQLYERLATFASHLGNVGKSLGDSVRAFNASVGSLERMVLPSARRFTDLGVQPRQRIVPPKSIEELTRDVTPAVDSPDRDEPRRRAALRSHGRGCSERRLARLSAGAPPISPAASSWSPARRPASVAPWRASSCARGATVILHGRNEKALEALYQELKPLGPEPSVAQIDLERAQGPEYQALTTEIESRYGRLDGLLHNAAILGDRSPIEHYDIGLWQRVLLVDLTAPFILTRCLLPLLRNSADASVVFTTSSVGRRGRAYWGAYAVAKAGIERLAEVLADELESTAVRVNVINPGAHADANASARLSGREPRVGADARKRRAGLPVFTRRREPRRPRPAFRRAGIEPGAALARTVRGRCEQRRRRARAGRRRRRVRRSRRDLRRRDSPG